MANVQQSTRSGFKAIRLKAIRSDVSPMWVLPKLTRELGTVILARRNAPTGSNQHRTLLQRERVLTRRMARIHARIQADKGQPHSRAYIHLMFHSAMQWRSDLAEQHQAIAQTFGTPIPESPPPMPRAFVRMITATDPPFITHSTQRRGIPGSVGGFHTASRYALRAQ